MKENEWISIYNYLPKINQKVEVRLTTGISYYGKFCFNSGELVFDSISTNEKYLWSYIHSWRNSPEQLPDFSKIKKGDLVMLELENSTYSKVGYVNHIKKDVLTTTRYKFMPGKLVIETEFSQIKKITRINIEKQTFEEI